MPVPGKAQPGRPSAASAGSSHALYNRSAESRRNWFNCDGCQKSCADTDSTIRAPCGSAMNLSAAQSRVEAVAVVFDLVQPIFAGGRFIDGARELRFDPPRRPGRSYHPVRATTSFVLKALVKLPRCGPDGPLWNTRIALPLANLAVETVEKPSAFLCSDRTAILLGNHQAKLNKDLNERLRDIQLVALGGSRTPLQDRPKDCLKPRHHACKECAPLGCMTIEFPDSSLAHRCYRLVGTSHRRPPWQVRQHCMAPTCHTICRQGRPLIRALQRPTSGHAARVAHHHLC
jgi:hypothetical protein